jgi:hypothetical protein
LGTSFSTDLGKGGLLLHVCFPSSACGQRTDELWHEQEVIEEEVIDLAKQLLADFRVERFVCAKGDTVSLEIKCESCCRVQSSCPQSSQPAPTPTFLTDFVFVLAADLDVDAFVLKRSMTTWCKLLTADVFEWMKQQRRAGATDVSAPKHLAHDHQGIETRLRNRCVAVVLCARAAKLPSLMCDM